MVKLKVLIVTYKIDLESSETLQSLLSVQHKLALDISVVMNSYSNENEEIKYNKSFHNIKVIKNKNNKKLSTIYNEHLESLKNDEYLLILDQDSKLEKTFIDKSISYLDGNDDVNLLLPQVFMRTKLVSPAYIKHGRGKYIKKITDNLLGKTTSKYMCAINSGLIIKATTAKKVKYDERLSFYFTDTKFLIDYQRQFQYIHISNAKIEHDLSQISSDNKEKAIFRERDNIMGLRISTDNLILNEIYVAYRCIRNMIKYHSFSFIKIWFRKC
ncbi:glycosyltransferase [bacterium 19MO04SH03]|uniref:Glycosyltransferase n=2 Tax=Unclassified Bacteria TaxID=49928 RepID=A0AAU6UQI5_UNCXX